MTPNQLASTKEGKSILAHERQVEEALQRAARRHTEPVEVRTPADVAMLKEELAAFNSDVAKASLEITETRELYAEWFRLWTDFVFEDGPHPGMAVRRLYLLMRIYRPALIFGMNGTELGMMFGESRAAVSWRTQQLFDRLKGTGAAAFRGGGCKRESTRAKYAASAEGNQNRRRKVVSTKNNKKKTK